ncbi:MAG: prephenate dehydrogenase [Peptostreptococcaceae bacterium]
MKITIVGLGVIGGSFAMALKEAGYSDIYGIDIDDNTIQKAKDMEIIKDGCSDGEKILKDSDLIIISLYPNLVKKFIEKNKNNFKEGSIITDTTGIKELFIEDVLQILPNNVEFVFGHPMAGREKKGLDFASSEVFKNANYLLINAEHNKEETLALVERIIWNVGFKSVKKISPKFHDEIIAFTSQLPHALAVALINSDEEGRETGRFIGDSYKELTRIANINEDLWCELFMGNKENLLKSIDEFMLELNKVKSAIQNDDDISLIEQFRKSSIRRQQL